MSDIQIVLTLIGVFGGVVVIVLVAAPLFRSRCPACSKFFGRVVSSREEASVETADFGYDDQRGEYRNIPVSHKGFLITRQCRACDHRWDRLESASRQLDRMSDAEAENYRKDHGR